MQQQRRLVRFFLATFAASVVLSALTTVSAQAAHPDGEKVRVNVYRYKQYFGKGLRPSIYCDEKDISRLQDGRYVVLLLTEGNHTFRSNDKQSQVELNLKPGQQYYIRVDIAAGMWKGHGRLTLVQPEQGVAELREMRPVDSGMIKDREVITADFHSN
jgi:hypothetical protein